MTQLLKPRILRKLRLLNSGWSLRTSGFALNSLESLKELSSDYQVYQITAVFAVNCNKHGLEFCFFFLNLFCFKPALQDCKAQNYVLHEARPPLPQPQQMSEFLLLCGLTNTLFFGLAILIISTLTEVRRHRLMLLICIFLSRRVEH